MPVKTLCAQTREITAKAMYWWPVITLGIYIRKENILRRSYDSLQV